MQADANFKLFWPEELYSRELQQQRRMVQLFFLEKGTQSARSKPHTTLMVMHSRPFENTRVDILSTLLFDWSAIQLLMSRTLHLTRKRELQSRINQSINTWNKCPTREKRELLIWKVGELNPLGVPLLLATPYTTPNTRWSVECRCQHKRCSVVPC